MDLSYEQFKKDFKRDLLIKIAVGMKHNSISRKNASELSTAILEALSSEEAYEVFARINKIGERHPEILEILIKRGKEHDERARREKMDLIGRTLNEYSMSFQRMQTQTGGEN